MINYEDILGYNSMFNKEDDTWISPNSEDVPPNLHWQCHKAMARVWDLFGIMQKIVMEVIFFAQHNKLP